MEKEFKTYDEMLSILESRGIDLSSRDLRGRAKRLLQHEGYYNLINGYKRPFLSVSADGSLIVPDRFRPGTTVDEISKVYYFDKKLRSIFLRNILYIENNIKSLVAYTFSREHGHKNYLVYSNFDISQRDSAKNITNLISDIHRQMAGRVSDPSIGHYLKVHGYVPLWVLNNILTLGTISKFYSLMKQPERQEIAKIFKVQEHELTAILTLLSSIRNICAHNNRLYCFRTKRPLVDMPIHALLSIPKSSNNEYLYGKRDLYAIMIIFKIMLPHNDFLTMVKQVNKELFDLSSNLNVISVQDILECMGFPVDWRTKFLNLPKH